MRLIPVGELRTITLFTLVPVLLLFVGDLLLAPGPIGQSRLTWGWYGAAALVGFLAGVFVAAMNTQKPGREAKIRIVPPPPY